MSFMLARGTRREAIEGTCPFPLILAPKEQDRLDHVMAYP